jgi:hypothetical protein
MLGKDRREDATSAVNKAKDEILTTVPIATATLVKNDVIEAGNSGTILKGNDSALPK